MSNITNYNTNQLQYIEGLQSTSKEKLLYTVKEVADLLKVNVNYVHNLRKAGLLRFIKLGQYKVTREALMEFLVKFSGYDLTNPFCVKEIANEQN